MSKFYIIIVGSRNFNDYHLMSYITDRMLVNHVGDDIQVVSGGAKGADALAKLYAKDKGYGYIEFTADWKTEGKKAGYLRNEKMQVSVASLSDAESCGRACLAFWDGASPGTKHNFSLCTKLNTPLKIYNYTLGSFVK